MFELIVATLLLGAPLSAQDTVFGLREGDRLVLEDLSGEVEVSTWNRSDLLIEADSDEGAYFEFHRTGNRVLILVLDRKGRNRSEDLRLRVPAWVELDLSGRRLDATVTGLEGSVRLRTLSGDLTLRDLSGSVEATTSNGEIDAWDLSGSTSMNAGGDDVTVVGASGSLTIETVSGDVELAGLASPSVTVRTTSGDVEFSGSLLPGGLYGFRSHSGNLTLELEGSPDMDVTALVYEGEFHSDFPVRTRGFQSGQEMGFTLGSGGGRLTLESFSGDLSLRRQGG